MTDEEQIRRVLALSMQFADDGDARGRSDLYADNAKYYPSSGEVIGRAAIYDSMAGRAGQRQDRKTKHMCSNSVVSIDGDSAQVVTDYIVYRRVAEGPWEIAQVGRYLDRFIRQGDAWLFSENRIVTI